MWLDAKRLDKFYQTPLGVKTYFHISRAIGELWPCTRHQCVVGYGYAHPYLDLFKDEADRVIQFMPAPQGATHWPKKRNSLTALIEETMWPLRDETVDRLLFSHSFEFTEHSADLLHEAWRVLKPEGELLVIAPNRRGFWAQASQTPYGYGTPYTGRQLFGVLDYAGFTPSKPTYCLYSLPIPSRMMLKFSHSFEALGPLLWKKFGGVVLCVAKKQKLAVLPKTKPVWSPRAFQPNPSPGLYKI